MQLSVRRSCIFIFHLHASESIKPTLFNCIPHLHHLSIFPGIGAVIVEAPCGTAVSTFWSAVPRAAYLAEAGDDTLLTV
jgi:hypothetical protein